MTRTICLALLFALPACSSPAGRPPDAFEGCATDENSATFDDYGARTTLDAQRAPRWLEPAPAAMLPAATVTALRWQPTPTDAGRPSGNASCPERCPTCRLQPEHLPPVSGNVYDLHVYAAGVEIYRVVTTLQSFTAEAGVWASWAGKDLSVDIVGTALLRNEVQGGPYRTEALRFSVKP